MNKLLGKPILVLIIIAFLIISSIPFQKKIDSKRNKFRSIEQSLYLSSSTLKKISLGFKELLADIYWFRALQYFGGEDFEFAKENAEKLHKYFDIITDLDPKFVNAYRFGGTFLAEPLPYGLDNLDLGVKLLDKGRENNPNNFRIPLEEAFLYYIYTDDHDTAANLFEEASNKPNLSSFRKASLKGMAASARLKGGDRELSKKIWEDIYRTTLSDGRKEFALRNLNELNTMDFEDKLTSIVKEYEEEFSNFPVSFERLVSAGYLKKIPKDHEGKYFVIAPKTKTIKSSALLEKFFHENIGYLNYRSKSFKRNYGRFPSGINELKNYIDSTPSLRDFPKHPLKEDYVYNPETGEVDYDKWWIRE